jgi:signal transduction histidine kinase
VTVRVVHPAGAVDVRVDDDGQGAAAGGFELGCGSGITGMRSRAGLGTQVVAVSYGNRR